MAILKGLEKNRRGQAGLADSGGADEDDVLGLGDEFEFGEAANLSLVYAFLLFERKRLERPLLWEPGVFDALKSRFGVRQRGLAACAGRRAAAQP